VFGSSAAMLALVPTHASVDEGQPRAIHLSPPHLTGAELARVAESLASGWCAPAGPWPQRFADRVAAITGFRHGVPVASGTAALTLAFRLLGIGPGDEVWVPSLTFIGSVAPAVHLGATPVFLDVSRHHWTLDPDRLAWRLARAGRRGQLPACVVAVDLYGQASDLETILGLCARWGVPVVSDSCEGLGALARGRPAGQGARIACYSFNGNKIVTAGGGGVLATDDLALAEHAMRLATQAKEPVPHYQHVELGWNFGLSSVLAAIGLAQLDALPARVESRRAIHARYHDALGRLPGIAFQQEPDWSVSTRWLSAMLIDPRIQGVDRETVRLALARQGIEARPVWKPMHLQPVFRSAPVDGGRVSAELFAHGLCLPSGSNLSEAQQSYIIDTVRAALRGGA